MLTGSKNVANKKSLQKTDTKIIGRTKGVKKLYVLSVSKDSKFALEKQIELLGI